MDIQPYLPGAVYAANYNQAGDTGQVAIYNEMLHETDFTRQRALMRKFEKHVVDTEAHHAWIVWWYRGIAHQSYMKGWKISPSHFLNQDLATVWLDK